MNRSKSVFVLAFFVIATLLFNSCAKDEYQSVAYGDVLIKSVKRGDSVVYGVFCYVYSWDKMAKATVNRDSEEIIIPLDSIPGRYTFTLIPDSFEFKTTKPLRAKYNFTIDFDNGEQYETFNFLDSVSLKPTAITECKFDVENEKLIIRWKADVLADQYSVFLKNEKNEIVFQSYALSANQYQFLISTYTNGWTNNNQPEGGEKYNVIISAYQYEPIPSPYNLQSISYSESGFIEWDSDRRPN